MKSTTSVFQATDILLPDFSTIEGTRWAVVACDQYTSEPQYWEAAEKLVGSSPSTLRMILPEVYLEEAPARIPAINAAMEDTLKKHLLSYPNAMIHLCRTQSDGTLRHGIIGAVDLEHYDFHAGTSALIRATEGTVLERIPPRVAIRRDASLELPHIMLLIDDPEYSVIEPMSVACRNRTPLYDFDLMLGGGHVCAHLLTENEQSAVRSALSALATPEAMEKRYNDATAAPLLFAVGDGNHSLATAKTIYEELKQSIGTDAAAKHPARYALAEVVNLHDTGLCFEPIYRVVFGCNPHALMKELEDYVASLNGNASPQKFTCIITDTEHCITVDHPVQQLAVGTLQSFLSDYSVCHPEVTVDYIHGEQSLRSLSAQPSAIGFLFEGMRKDELFRTVIYDGALPRKTFSMGHADDKRYYLECKRIK